VLFPAYSLIQRDGERLRRAYLNSLTLSSIVVFPLLTSIAIVGPELMTGVFGPKWAAAGAPLQILCLGGVFQCMYKPADCLARAKGAVYLQFCCHTLYTLCVVGGSLAGLPWDITGVAVGVVGALAVIYLLTAAVSLRVLNIDWWSGFFLPQLPGAILAGAVFTLALPTTLLLRARSFPPLAIFVGGFTMSLLALLTALVLLPRTWIDKHVLDALASALRSYSARLKGQAKGILRYYKRAYRGVELFYKYSQYIWQAIGG
jgi:O-antigen/teichoic acid export membrane protein